VGSNAFLAASYPLAFRDEVDGLRRWRLGLREIGWKMVLFRCYWAILDCQRQSKINFKR